MTDYRAHNYNILWEYKPGQNHLSVFSISYYLLSYNLIATGVSSCFCPYGATVVPYVMSARDCGGMCASLSSSHDSMHCCY